MKRFYSMLVCLFITSITYAQNNLYLLLNEVKSSVDVPHYYDGGRLVIYGDVVNFYSLSIEDNNLIIKYIANLNIDGHINKHNFTITIDIPKSEINKTTDTKVHKVNISSAAGIKVTNTTSSFKETYYVDDWGIEVNSEALESKIYNAFRDIWTENITPTQSSSSSVKENPSNSSKQTSTNTAANEYKYYQESRFAIKKSYKLEENTMFIDAFRQNQTDGLELVSAYTCFQNAETQDPNYINVINIVVYKIDAPAEQTLAEYKRNLIANRFPCSNKTWNGLQGLEYSFKQDMGNVMLPTKAFYGYKGNKFYLIQIGTLVDTDKKYNALLNSIKIL